MAIIMCTVGSGIAYGVFKVDSDYFGLRSTDYLDLSGVEGVGKYGGKGNMFLQIENMEKERENEYVVMLTASLGAHLQVKMTREGTEIVGVDVIKTYSPYGGQMVFNKLLSIIPSNTANSSALFIIPYYNTTLSTISFALYSHSSPTASLPTVFKGGLAFPSTTFLPATSFYIPSTPSPTPKFLISSPSSDNPLQY